MIMQNQTLGVFQQQHMVMALAHSSLMDVQELARVNGVHHVPVMKHERLVGVVCTCDMMIEPPDTPVWQVMKDPITLSPEATIAEAARLMKERFVGSVVLVKNQVPCGIVTRGDIFIAAPETAHGAELQRCSCCGLARHLRVTDSGVLCIFCEGRREPTREPG